MSECMRCGLPRFFSVFCFDCLEDMSLAEAFRWELAA